jgi:ribosomal protein S27AE
MSKDEYDTKEWYDLKDHVLSLAHRVCADCGWTATTAHHLTYAYGIICPPQYLVALCAQCHDVRHGLSNWRRETHADYQRRMGFVEVDGFGPGALYPQGKYWKFKGRSERREGTEEAQSLRDLLSPENFRLSPGRDGLGDSEASEGSLAFHSSDPNGGGLSTSKTSSHAFMSDSKSAAAFTSAAVYLMPVAFVQRSAVAS